MLLFVILYLRTQGNHLGPKFIILHSRILVKLYDNYVKVNDRLRNAGWNVKKR